MTPQQAINALIEAGWTEARIAADVGTSQPTIHRIKHGRQRRGAAFATCQAIIELAQKTMQADGEGPPASTISEAA